MAMLEGYLMNRKRQPNGLTLKQVQLAEVALRTCAADTLRRTGCSLEMAFRHAMLVSTAFITEEHRNSVVPPVTSPSSSSGYAESSRAAWGGVKRRGEGRTGSSKTPRQQHEDMAASALAAQQKMKRSGFRYETSNSTASGTPVCRDWNKSPQKCGPGPCPFGRLHVCNVKTTSGHACGQEHTNHECNSAIKALPKRDA